jgi:hypothetical protein
MKSLPASQITGQLQAASSKPKARFELKAASSKPQAGETAHTRPSEPSGFGLSTLRFQLSTDLQGQRDLCKGLGVEVFPACGAVAQLGER